MIPSPDSPAAPKYWMYETSGVLKPVIEKYLRGATLGPNELGIFRAYLRQWIQSPAWDHNPHATEQSRSTLNDLRGRINSIDNMERLKKWIAAAVAEGLDPL